MNNNHQKKYNVLNFDHKFTQETTFKIDQYTITVNQKQAENIEKLRKNAEHLFVTDNNLKRNMEEVSKKNGETVNTATIKIDRKNITDSVIYPKFLNKNSVDDFVLFLSFITGRRVYLESELKDVISIKYFNCVVDRGFFYSPNSNIKKGFDKIKKLNFSTAFYNLTYTKTSENLLTIFFYANSVLNRISDKWCKDNSASKYPFKISKKTIDECKKLVESHLNENLTYAIDVISDITNRVAISNQPSAIYKLQNFLIGLGLMQENPDKEMFDRLKLLDIARNSIIHRGDIPSDKKIDIEQLYEITASITFVIVAIAEYYFATEIFEIDNKGIEQIKEEIQSYFTSGKLNGKDVFNENYEQYLERQRNEWVNNGNYV
jgi:hypothetical protein